MDDCSQTKYKKIKLLLLLKYRDRIVLVPTFWRQRSGARIFWRRDNLAPTFSYADTVWHVYVLAPILFIANVFAPLLFSAKALAPKPSDVKTWFSMLRSIDLLLIVLAHAMPYSQF